MGGDPTGGDPTRGDPTRGDMESINTNKTELQKRSVNVKGE